MFSGSYKRSQELFESFVQSNSECASEWDLKLYVLKFIGASLKIDSQKRKIKDAIKLFDNCESLSDEQMFTTITTALENDALCGLAWFNQGVLALKSANKNDALIPFLIEALVHNWDVVAWCNALALSIFPSGASTLPFQIIETAYRFNKSKFIDQVVKFSKSPSSGFPADTFVVVQYLRALPETTSPIVVRLLTGETEYEVISLNTPDKSQRVTENPMKSTSSRTLAE